MLRLFLSRYFLSPVENLPNISVWEKWGQNIKFCFRDPQKGTSLRETTSVDVLAVKIGAGVLAVGGTKNHTRCSAIQRDRTAGSNFLIVCYDMAFM